MGPLESAMDKRGGQHEESSNHILCQCPALVMYKIENFRSPWLELTDIRRGLNQDSSGSSIMIRVLGSALT
jgi:hypothetical protein